MDKTQPSSSVHVLARPGVKTSVSRVDLLFPCLFLHAAQVPILFCGSLLAAGLWWALIVGRALIAFLYVVPRLVISSDMAAWSRAFCRAGVRPTCVSDPGCVPA